AQHAEDHRRDAEREEQDRADPRGQGQGVGRVEHRQEEAGRHVTSLGRLGGYPTEHKPSPASGPEAMAAGRVSVWAWITGSRPPDRDRPVSSETPRKTRSKS